jgi:hypothetical protein
MSEAPFEDDFDPEESDILGPEFEQVQREVQDDDGADVVAPEFEDDSEEDLA